jgi:hypothetical protein
MKVVVARTNKNLPLFGRTEREILFSMSIAALIVICRLTDARVSLKNAIY